MKHFLHNGNTYPVDDQGFLLDPQSWDMNFAEGMAKECEIQSLSSEHWDVINFIREAYKKTGACPTIFAVCNANGLRPREMKKLFPTGYHRGMCRIAGVHYRINKMPFEPHSKERSAAELEALAGGKTYTVDVRGFLVDPETWDENYALHRALEMKIPKGQLTDKHWQVIDYLRSSQKQRKQIPNIYEVCENCQLEFDEFENLFPDGYHRGALKIAGLRFAQ
ncbi:MAG: TusE/DsrC/DsvC family sulfur relay protein [Desulfocapsaceae bacterium]|nr:TusE/DsrC/DsvC family sulfur relay protein [Desulfocapsaceae bacterium]